MTKKLLFIILSLLLLTTPAFADTLNLQVAASADNCIVYNNGSVWDIVEGVEAGNYSAGVFKAGSGLRFNNVTIPQGATIVTAYLTITGGVALSGTTCNAKIIGDLETDAATFSTLADYQARRGTDVGGADNTKRTTAEVDWDNLSAWVVGTEYQSPEIKTIIQEIVDQGGWVSGNDLALFWDDHDNRSSSGAARIGSHYAADPTKAVKLHIEYTAGTRRIIFIQ